WFVPASDAQYIGIHWLLTPTGQFISRYPPGLAVLIGAVYDLGGWKAAALVNPALSVLTLIGFFLLARLVIGSWWALVGVAVLIINPTFTHHALSGDSHMGVAFILVWGIYFLVRWSEEGKIRFASAPTPLPPGHHQPLTRTPADRFELDPRRYPAAAGRSHTL
ncbi:MAG: hypothetical protein M3O30_17590, partial [Planctomycetota bacterium]|nr:hypothetical protein [Planctomycetota bacterium]